MEEEIKLIEENIDYNSLIFGYGNAELSERIRNAIRHLIQAYKEDKAVMHCVIEDIRSIDCVYSHEELEQRYRNKVKGEKR